MTKENPHETIKISGMTPTFTVWALISFSGFMAIDIDRQTMNSERYCVILNEKVVPYFQRRKDMFFQQDGAAPHYSRGHWISIT